MSELEDEMDWEHFAHRTTDLLCASDTQGVIAWVNPRWEAVLGYTNEDLHARSLIELVHPDDVDHSLSMISRMVAGEEVPEFVNRFRHVDGSYRWIEWGVSWPDGEGPAYSIGRDVTERVVRERKQAEQLALLETMEELAGLGRWRLDVVSGEGYWSPEVFRIFGLPVSDRPPPFEEGLAMWHPDDRERISANFARSVETRQSYEHESRIVRPDGQIRWTVTNGMVAESEHEGSVVMHGIIRDVTDERERAERLVHTERLASIGQMAAGVAHEINNPLQFITMSVELLEEEFSGLSTPSTDLEELESIREGTDRIAKIVNALRRFGRRPSGERERVRPGELLDGALGLVRGLKERRVSLVVPDDLPELELDPQSLHQVLVNLLSNAFQSNDAAGGAGSVEVEVSSRMGSMGEQVVWEVRDEGVGIDPAEADRLFEPFYTTRFSRQSTGLGLAVARGLVAANGGVLTLENRPGGGAIARMVLPAAPPRVPATPVATDATSSAPAPTPAQGRRVLLIDDEELILDTLGKFLRHKGFVVETANGVERALEVLSERSDWDLVLCDMRMPELGGPELWSRVLADHAEVAPAVRFMTGDSWSDENRDFLERHGRPYLAKPFSLPELMGFLTANLEHTP